MIVSIGLRRASVGSTLASATNRPGTSCASPLGATTEAPASAPMRAVPMGWNASSRSSAGRTRPFSMPACSPGRTIADPRDLRVDLGRARREVDLRRARDPERELRRVVAREAGRSAARGRSGTRTRPSERSG